MSDPRFAADALVTFASALAERAGVRADMARDLADVLVTGDLLGHTTHGLALLGPYLAEIEKGSMTKSGEPWSLDFDTYIAVETNVRPPLRGREGH